MLQTSVKQLNSVTYGREIQKNNDIQLWKSWFPKRWEIYYCDLDGIGCEEQGIRPVVILSNNIGNSRSPICTIAPLTSKSRMLSKIHVFVNKEYGLKKSSFILLEHLKSIDKRRFFINNFYPFKIIELPEEKIKEIEEGIREELGLDF